MGSVQDHVGIASPLTVDILTEAVVRRGRPHGKEAEKTILLGLKQIDAENRKRGTPTHYEAECRKTFNLVAAATQKSEASMWYKNSLENDSHQQFGWERIEIVNARSVEDVLAAAYFDSGSDFYKDFLIKVREKDPQHPGQMRETSWLMYKNHFSQTCPFPCGSHDLCNQRWDGGKFRVVDEPDFKGLVQC